MPRYTTRTSVTRHPDLNPIVSVFGGVCALGMVLCIASAFFIGVLYLLAAVLLLLGITTLITKIANNVNRKDQK